MSSRSTILLKEARALLWPWCAVMLAGTLSLLLPFMSWFAGSLLLLVYRLGFAIGIPLLAALSLGNEFQHRTVSLLLSQPVDRMRIWNAKWSVLILAVLSSALVYAVGQWTIGQRPTAWAWVFASLWLIVTVCSGTFWTLVAKS